MAKKEDIRGGKAVFHPAMAEDITEILMAQNMAFPDDPSNLTHDQFSALLADPTHRLVVAKVHGIFAGFIHVNNRRMRPWTSLDHLVVMPDFRHQGLAKALLKIGIKPLKGRFLIRLYVEAQNFKAQKLYKAFGFLTMQRKEAHYENNDDALIMLGLARP